DRIVGSAKEFAGRAEGAIGDMAGDAQTQASGKAREAAGTVQNIYGQAKDAVRDAADTATNYAKDAYENSGETLRGGSQAISQKVQD
ncbi:CsbD family protein, partial [Pseudomonas sp. MPR-AND1A]